MSKESAKKKSGIVLNAFWRDYDNYIGVELMVFWFSLLEKYKWSDKLTAISTT